MSAPTSAVVRLQGRISYPQLFRAVNLDKQNPDKEPKFSGVLIFDKNKDKAQIELVRKTIKDLLNTAYGSEAKVPKGFKLCLRDGLEKEDTDGYGPDVMFVSASNKKRPLVVNRDATPLVEADSVIYAGCRANMTVTFWVQDNGFGKRVNANLRGVQFVADDEEFGDGGSNIDPETEFEALPDADVLG